MIDLKDLARPPVLLALAGGAALGFAAGFVLGRDPQLLRRVLAAAAASWEQTRMAVAEVREDVADRWAEATEEARDDIEEAAFAAAPAGAATAAPKESGAAPVARPARRSRSAGTTRRAAPRTTH